MKKEEMNFIVEHPKTILLSRKQVTYVIPKAGDLAWDAGAQLR